MSATMNKLALVVALAIAAFGGALLYLYLQRFELEVSGGAPLKLLVVIKPLEPGDVLKDDMLATRLVPKAYVENRAVRESERSKVVGMRVSTPLQPQQSLMWTDLAMLSDDRRALSSLVQPGMRAVGVRATNDDKSFALIRPGDRVDVIATLAKSESEAHRTAVVLLQNVLVLAVGLDTGAEAIVGHPTGEFRDLILSVSLNIAEAQLLQLAAEKARISVALRNPDDVRTTEGLADIESSALVNEQQRKILQHLRQQPSVPVRLAPQDGSQ